MNAEVSVCRLCPRQCGKPRGATEGGGFCRMPLRPVLARAGLHSWEEPPLSGTRGAGTVFFSGCVLRCVYCQNDKISRENFGRAVTVPRLRGIFQELIAQGAHNIDLVNPTHFAPAIAEALHEPLSVPVIWNSGGYERVSALRTLAGKIQIYLPDFKYPDAEAAEKYSGARDYPAVAAGAIREMAEQTGGYEYGENGLLRRGVLIRHLLLPGRVSQAKQVMDWIAGTFPPKTVLFSLMSQYTPTAGAGKFPELNRKLRPSEIRAAAEYMSALGLEGFTQDLAAAEESYVPPFDGTGI